MNFLICSGRKATEYSRQQEKERMVAFSGRSNCEKVNRVSLSVIPLYVFSFSLDNVIDITCLANNMYVFLYVYFWTNNTFFLTNAKLYIRNHEKFHRSRVKGRRLNFDLPTKIRIRSEPVFVLFRFGVRILKQGFGTVTPGHICIYCVQFCSFHNNVKVYFTWFPTTSNLIIPEGCQNVVVGIICDKIYIILSRFN